MKRYKYLEVRRPFGSGNIESNIIEFPLSRVSYSGYIPNMVDNKKYIILPAEKDYILKKVDIRGENKDLTPYDYIQAIREIDGLVVLSVVVLSVYAKITPVLIHIVKTHSERFRNETYDYYPEGIEKGFPIKVV